MVTLILVYVDVYGGFGVQWFDGDPGVGGRARRRRGWWSTSMRVVPCGAGPFWCWSRRRFELTGAPVPAVDVDQCVRPTCPMTTLTVVSVDVGAFWVDR